MVKIKIPYHLVILLFILWGILSLFGAQVKWDQVHDPRPRILSLVTKVPEGFVKVVDTVDGDTIKVYLDGKEETVRLLGVDTPETKDPRKGVQCFGREASAYTKEVLMGKAVKLIPDPMETDRDNYGRLLRYVALEDGTIFNELLVARGIAFAYERFPTERLERLKEMERQARELNIGLWGGCDVTIKNNGKQKNTQEVSEL